MIKTTHWKYYQQKVSDFFVSIGAKTELETPIKGARGNHGYYGSNGVSQFGPSEIPKP